MYSFMYNFSIKIQYFMIVYDSSKSRKKSAGSLDFNGFRHFMISYDSLQSKTFRLIVTFPSA